MYMAIFNNYCVSLPEGSPSFDLMVILHVCLPEGITI